MEIIHQNHVIDTILNRHHKQLGNDLLGYSGHCYRMLNYIYLLGMREEDMALLEIALPFHDLGIWTEKTMDYLEPSFNEAKAYVLKEELEVDLGHLKLLIMEHHKVNPISNSSLAEHFRKADLIDLSFGLIRFGISRKDLKQIRRTIPYYRFQISVLRKVLAYALTHLRRPFPMMRK